MLECASALRPNYLRGELPMEQRSVTFYRWSDMPREKVTDMLDRRCITADRMMLSHVYLKKGAIVPQHSHENEQLTYILEGGLRFWIGPDESKVIDVMAGELLQIRSHETSQVQPSLKHSDL